MSHSLVVKNLSVNYSSKLAVDNLSFEIAEGEAVSLVGESGCGKSTTALSIMKLIDGAEIKGQVLFNGTDLSTLTEEQMTSIRGKEIGIIFQDPMTSLNPVYTIGKQISEVLSAHTSLNRSEIKTRVLELLKLVKIPEPEVRIGAYPHQLSGGQRQRVCIAMAVACSPKLLIADEPTTALDAQVQAEILELISKLRREMSMSLLFISHNLPVVSKYTDRVVVMHGGKKLEDIGSEELFVRGTHPYTAGLSKVTMKLGDKRHYSSTKLPEIQIFSNNGETTYSVNTPQHNNIERNLYTSERVLDVKNLSVSYKSNSGKTIDAVKDVSLSVSRGQTLGLVGESGSGKTSLSKAIMYLIPKHNGSVNLNGTDLDNLKTSALRKFRRNVQMVFQDPFSSLNPRHSVDEILRHVLKEHENFSYAESSRIIAKCIDDVGLPVESLSKLPHEFSGGQRQRIAIARAIILKPSLIICDEPVSALDVSVQAQILNLMTDLKSEHNLSYLFISHDLAVVQYMSDNVMVMKEGSIIEEGVYEDIWNSPQHPYTQSLISAY